jgi:hypothetical protein
MGEYLAVAVLYAAIFGESPEGLAPDNFCLDFLE